jgi:signal transduction histidine kinase
VQARLAQALLAPGEYAKLVERAARLAESRARVVDAQAAELRRIERDLHDGAQARIVAAGMTLALADRKLRSGEQAAPDVWLARRQLDEALADLRHLVRGIHPPILTDRGLHQALTALAADSPLDVRLHGDPVDRFPPAVESAAYFVVGEGLTNAAKHADATSCDITLTRGAESIVVTIGDNGRGGADPTGAGLDGLRRRVEALDGTLTLTSPPGGPTVLTAEFPCAS